MMNAARTRWAGLRGLLVVMAVSACCTVSSFGADAVLTYRYPVQFSPDELDFGTLMGFDTVRLLRADTDTWNEPGAPNLPVLVLRLAVPEGMRVTGVHAEGLAMQDLPGEYKLFPSQPWRRISEPGQPEFVEPDPKIYNGSSPFPAEPVQLVHQADLAGQAFVRLRVCPLRYVPAEKRLLLIRAMEIVLEGEPGYVCGDYLPATMTRDAREAYTRRVQDLVVNPDEVRLQQVSGAVSRNLPPGAYDYVIITQPNWVDDFQPLADWKTRKGVPATIVTTDWIFYECGYGGTDEARIRAFVQDAHETWGARYFLLGGDTNVVTYHVWTSGQDDIPNDTYYADYDGDWVCEVDVGRASVRNAGAVATFINKVLTYEISPPLTDYATTATFLGFDLNQYGSGEGEGCKQAIDDLYLPDDWTLRTEYDSEPGGHKADATGYLNLGNNLVNHIDHSSTNVMGVGSVNHGDHFDNGDMSNLTNGDRQSILYSIGCWACNYADDSTCIAEAFVRNPNGGGIAFVGNSRYGWYIPFQTDGASSHYDRYFFLSLFMLGENRLGACFSEHKNAAYATDAGQYIFTELTLLGDPELPVWRADPASLSVTHADQLEANVFTDFPVSVTAGGEPLPNATVCLWKGDEVYEVEQTDETGTATFWFAPYSEGSLLVTVRKDDYLPYLGEATVVEGDGPFVLTILVEGEGSVSVDPAVGPYEPGTPVTLTATAEPGWCFDEWRGGLSGSSNPETLVMDGNRIVTAVFAPDCNANGQPDADDILTGVSPDCNENAVPDECDIAAGTSQDCQPNGVPDECDVAPPDFVEAADVCSQAQIICPPNVYSGTTEGATGDGTADCGESAGTADVWYYYVPYGNGYLTLSLCGSPYDTVLSVHTGCPGTIENQIACNDDFCNEQSQLSVLVQHGQEYWIRVSGRNGATGPFELSVFGPGCYYTEGDENQNGIPDECEVGCAGQTLGDANCDGQVNAFDIDAFVLALTESAGWEAQYGGACDLPCVCDINGDGGVNAFDIDPFVQLLTGK